MKAKELRDLSHAELEQKLREIEESLFHLRMELSSGKLENPLKIREVRRDISRIETIMKEIQPPVAKGRLSASEASSLGGRSPLETGSASGITSGMGVEKEEGKKKSENSR